jgi:ribonuclease J
VFVACFASNVHRIQGIVNAARAFGRRVAFLGRAMENNVEIARTLGYLDFPAWMPASAAEARTLPPKEICVLTTGTQGEPRSALARLARGDHPELEISAGDLVILSSRFIPGNEIAVGQVVNDLTRRGAEVVYESLRPLHVSGHAQEAEQRRLISLARPAHFVPIHGEYRHLARHAQIAGRVSGGGTRVLVAQNGDVIRFGPDEARIADRVQAGRVLIDGTRAGEVADEVLRDRRHLSADGLVVPVLAISRQTGAIEGVPDIITRGFVVDGRVESVLADAGPLLTDIIESASVEERTDVGLIKERVRIELQRVVRKRSGRRPLVLPVVMEV